METLYTARITVHTGRNGSVRSDDGLLDARLAFPTTLGGDGKGTNPEQLFGAGYAACFGSTLEAVARAEGKRLTDLRLDAEVDMLKEGPRFDLAIRIVVHASGVSRAELGELITKARDACPYARATGASLRTSVVAG